jgi:hypothetical protein
MLNAILSVIGEWKDLFVKVFTVYPLAAALLTIVAVGVFFWLEETQAKNGTAINATVVLLCWAVAVPVFGFLLIMLEKIWDFLEAVLPWLARTSGSFYSIYARHPILVSVLVLLGILSYLAWSVWWARLWPNRYVRAVVVISAVVLVAHIASPIADLFAPTPSPEADQKAPVGTPVSATPVTQIRSQPTGPARSGPAGAAPKPATTAPAAASRAP